MEGVVAVISLALSIVLAVYYFKDHRRAAFEIEAQHTEMLLAWHGEVVAVLVRLRDLDREANDPGHREELAQLSALIEQGRFYFPNIDKGDDFGVEKPSAYRGYRNLALDFLVASYSLLKSPSSIDRLEEAYRLQRYFTSIVFEVVRPIERLKEIRRHTDRYMLVSETFEDFRRRRDGALIDHIWRHRK